jgi:hypothetical protein
MDAVIFPGEDEAKVKADIEFLIEQGWSLHEKIQLSKIFYFKMCTKVLVQTKSCPFPEGSGGFLINHS